MSNKRNNAIPPAFLSLVKRSTNSGNNTDSSDDDRAFLLPSNDSSFNLTGDSEVLTNLKSSSSSSKHNHRTGRRKSKRQQQDHHHDHNSNSQRHNNHHAHPTREGMMSRASSSAGSQLSGRSSSSGASNNAQQSNYHPKSYHKQSSMPTTSPSSISSNTTNHRSSGGRGSSYYKRQYTDPLPGNNSSSRNNNATRESSSASNAESATFANNDDNAFFVGYDTDRSTVTAARNPLSPIASTSFESATSNANEFPSVGGVGASDGGGGQPLTHVPESNESLSPSNKSTRSDRGRARSERSYKSSCGSNKSMKSSIRRRKVRREEKFRDWDRKRRRRRFLGIIALTLVYSILFAYTILVTLGPLALNFWIDPTEWCPYYYDEFWEDSQHDEEEESKNSEYVLNIDQLQQTRQQLGEKQNGRGYQRRSLSSQREAMLKDELKELNIHLLQKTSKDVHSNTNDDEDSDESTSKYENPDYDNSPCHTSRLPYLLYLTLEECDLSRRMASSVLFGGFIGYERRASDRPAGIRTMALVALGSCFFTLSSQLAFRDSPMTWDSSRVSAAIPSGVGFLGAGLIWKGTLSDGNGGEVHQVHGITTAASVWLAAAVGVGAGGALYAVTAYSTALVILVLRFGPRLYFQNDKGFEHDEEEDDYEEDDDSEGIHEGDYGEIPEKERMPTVDDQSVAESGIKHSHDSEMEMHDMDHSTIKPAAAVKCESKGYGSTDAYVEDNAVARLLQQDQKRQLERLNKTQTMLSGSEHLNNAHSFFTWLGKFMPGKKERQQPLNPYQALSRDRDIVRLMKKKKSMGRMSSRPSFCT